MKTNAWVARFPVGLFAIPLGFFALAGAWRRAAGFGWEIAASISTALAWGGVALLSLLLLTYAAHVAFHPKKVTAAYAHPVTGSLMALTPLSVLLGCIYFGEPGHPGWLALTLAALCIQGLIAWKVVASVATNSVPTAAITPALYLPPVGGGLVGAMALNTLAYPLWAAWLFGMGLAAWALLEVRVLDRLFEGAMPEALRPTIGVELAPPIVATLAAASIWPALPVEALVVCLGICVGPMVTVLTRYRWWSSVPFAIGFWSFSFPLASLSAVVMEVVRRGGWPPLVGGMALTLSTGVIAFLLVKTLALLAQGKILPPAPAPSA